jgi:predicted dehydrogenase
MRRIKVGVIGCGVMGGFHLKQYGNIPDVEIVGASDIDPSRAPQGIRFFNDHSALLELVDAVSITTPTVTHFDVGTAALDAGCHVLIEKPIAVTPDQGRKLIDKARSGRKVLAVGHIERFNPAYAALLKHLGKAIPEIIDIRRYSPFPARISDVSCVIDMMIHDIDLALRLARSEVKHLKAVGKKVRTDKLDQAFAVIAFKNGVVANIEANRVHGEKIRALIVAGDKKTYKADLLNRSLRASKNGRSGGISVRSYDQLHAELEDFVKAVAGKGEPSVTGEDGLSALEIAESVEEEVLKT